MDNFHSSHRLKVPVTGHRLCLYPYAGRSSPTYDAGACERRDVQPADAGDQPSSFRDAELLALKLMHLGPQSKMALKMALLALDTPGGEGTLTIKIPKNPKDYPDLSFTTN